MLSQRRESMAPDPDLTGSVVKDYRASRIKMQ